ncbi:MAG TPA: hypothetical protein VLM79_07700 [Kofleriaceae bacterium]|nr:hypothetical protein [Kofleriaceae bacterium]
MVAVIAIAVVAVIVIVIVIVVTVFVDAVRGSQRVRIFAGEDVREADRFGEAIAGGAAGVVGW